MTLKKELWARYRREGWSARGTEAVKRFEGIAHVVHLHSRTAFGTTDWFAEVGLYVPSAAPFATVWAAPPFDVSIDTCCLTETTPAVSVDSSVLPAQVDQLEADIQLCLSRLSDAEAFRRFARERLTPKYLSRPLPCMYVAYLLATDPSSPEIDRIMEEVLPGVLVGDPEGTLPLQWSNERFIHWVRQHRLGGERYADGTDFLP